MNQCEGYRMKQWDEGEWKVCGSEYDDTLYIESVKNLGPADEGRGHQSIAVFTPGSDHRHVGLFLHSRELYAELSNVLEWALTEKAPLRDQEIVSIRAVLAKAGM